jgi:hypothetical protein
MSDREVGEPPWASLSCEHDGVISETRRRILVLHNDECQAVGEGGAPRVLPIIFPIPTVSAVFKFLTCGVLMVRLLHDPFLCIQLRNAGDKGFSLLPLTEPAD